MGGNTGLTNVPATAGWFGEKQGNSLHGTPRKLQEVNITCNAECESLQGVDYKGIVLPSGFYLKQTQITISL